MPSPDVITLYFAISAAVFAAFERAEKFSSRENLDTVYLLITVRRSKFSVMWYQSLIRFIDSLLGRRSILSVIEGPSFARVAIYSFTTTSSLFLLIFHDGHFGVSLLLFLCALPITFTFDYINFTKTRMLLGYVTPRRTIVAVLVALTLEYAITVILMGLAVLAFVYSGHLLVDGWPQLTAKLLGLAPIVEDDHINWDETFYRVGLTGTPNVFGIMIANMVAMSLSTVLVILFILATVASYLANNVQRIQRFLDQHTAVVEKPLQVLGIFAVALVTLIFWFAYLAHFLVEDPWSIPGTIFRLMYPYM